MNNPKEEVDALMAAFEKGPRWFREALVKSGHISTAISAAMELQEADDASRTRKATSLQDIYELFALEVAIHGAPRSPLRVWARTVAQRALQAPGGLAATELLSSVNDTDFMRILFEVYRDDIRSSAGRYNQQRADIDDHFQEIVRDLHKQFKKSGVRKTPPRLWISDRAYDLTKTRVQGKMKRKSPQYYDPFEARDFTEYANARLLDTFGLTEAWMASPLSIPGWGPPNASAEDFVNPPWIPGWGSSDLSAEEFARAYFKAGMTGPRAFLKPTHRDIAERMSESRLRETQAAKRVLAEAEKVRTEELRAAGVQSPTKEQLREDPAFLAAELTVGKIRSESTIFAQTIKPRIRLAFYLSEILGGLDPAILSPDEWVAGVQERWFEYEQLPAREQSVLRLATRGVYHYEILRPVNWGDIEKHIQAEENVHARKDGQRSNREVGAAGYRELLPDGRESVHAAETAFAARITNPHPMCINRGVCALHDRPRGDEPIGEPHHQEERNQ